jgi:hypothetical protein
MNTFKITPGIQTGLKAVGRQVRVGTVFRPEGTVLRGVGTGQVSERLRLFSYTFIFCCVQSASRP